MLYYYMNEKIKLSVLGFSFNQAKTGAYGLVLAEEGSMRRLMVIVGTPEAQAIAFKLQDIPPPRPLTHDLIQSLMQEFDLKLIETNIYKYKDGIFYSKLLIEKDNCIVEVESRTSDAVGVALRMNAPIYTNEQIMQEIGVVFEENQMAENVEAKPELSLSVDYSLLSSTELNIMLNDAIEGEDYELASILRDEIDKKKKSDEER